jgi:hypothetical protein
MDAQTVDAIQGLVDNVDAQFAAWYTATHPTQPVILPGASPQTAITATVNNLLAQPLVVVAIVVGLVYLLKR